MASDKTIPQKNDFWSDRPRLIVYWLDYGALESPCVLKLRSKTSDQTFVRSNVTLWLD